LNVEERDGLLATSGGERERERERERQGDKDRSFTELRERQEQGRQELCRGERDSGQNLALK
jgi:hypothetical protein